MSRLCLCLLLVSAFASTALADDEPSDPEVVARARTLTSAAAKDLARGRYEDAARRFEAVLDLVDTPESRMNLALALSRLGDTALAAEHGDEALRLFDRALELHPGRITYEVRRGRALFLLGQEREALRVADDLANASPRFGEAWLLKADVEERRGELAGAVEALEAAIPLLHAGNRLLPRYAELKKRLETEGEFLTHATGHFEVKYGPDVDPKTVELALTLLEDAWSDVTSDLGIVPRSAARVVLYSGGEFQDVTGAHGWVGALYSNGTLRVPVRNLERHQDVAARILSHEFTHHVLRETTPGLPVWWHEGIAQWTEATSEPTRRRYEQIARQLPVLRDRGSLLTLDQLQRIHIASTSNTNVVQLYYAQAKSFVLWIVDRFGARSLTEFLLALGTSEDTSAAAKEAFGSSEAKLFAEWREAL